MQNAYHGAVIMAWLLQEFIYCKQCAKWLNCGPLDQAKKAPIVLSAAKSAFTNAMAQ